MTQHPMLFAAAGTNMQSASNNASYAAVKPAQSSKVHFVNMADSTAVEALRTQYSNRDLLVSACRSTMPDPMAPRSQSLYLYIGPGSLENVRKHALEACYHLAEYCCIPQDCMDVIYDGGGENTGHADQDGRDNAGAGDHPDHKEIDSAGAAIARPAKMIILVPPVVFDGRATPLMAALNRRLAEQMSREGVGGLDIDVYIRDPFIPLPNAINGATARFVISLRVEEALYLDARGISDLSKKPRPDDSYAAGRHVPEAAEWFAEALKEEEKHAEKQSRLREALLRSGWQVPPCIRRLDWADMSEDQALEACRIIARFYPFLHAREDEVWYHVRRLDQRHGIGDYPRLRNIVTFGMENPAYVGCEHPLLQRFCPAGRCFVTELISEYENPLLFT
jgi:hypothetical protein